MKEWLRSLRPSYREVTLDGARARYLCGGSGPPLLLVASPLALARTYQRAIRALCRSFTVVCVELPGSGGSERLAEPWSVERYAEWVLDLVRYLPLAAPVVVGHGGSTAIAAELAKLAPSEIGGLVLVDAPGTSTQLGVRSLPQMAWNALYHRSTFAEHVRNACTASAALLGGAVAVPTVRATLRADHWKVVAADVGPLTSAIRRFVAAVRYGPVFAASPAPPDRVSVAGGAGYGWRRRRHLTQRSSRETFWAGNTASNASSVREAWASSPVRAMSSCISASPSRSCRRTSRPTRISSSASCARRELPRVSVASTPSRSWTWARGPTARRTS